MKEEKRHIKEIEQLSAYLDNALEPEARQKLEARLAQESALRESLENLRKTKLLVGNLPRLKAPRNFTLTPDVVEVHRSKPQPLISFLRLASSLATILLVILFGVELILKGPLINRVATAPEPMSMEALRYDEETPEPLIFWEQPGYGGAGEGVPGTGGDVTVYTEEELAPETEVIPEEPEIEEQAPKEEPAEDRSAPETEDLLILGINTDEGGEIIKRSKPSPVQAEPQESGPDYFLWAQIALGVIALGGGITLLILRRSRLL